VVGDALDQNRNNIKYVRGLKSIMVNSNNVLECLVILMHNVGSVLMSTQNGTQLA